MGALVSRVKETEYEPHGPRIDDILVNAPPFMVAFWIIGIASFITSITIFSRHSKRLYSVPSTDIRDYYMRIIAFPLVLCGTSCINLFFARPTVLWTLMQRIYEAIALVAFRQLLLRLLGHDILRVADRLRSGPKVHLYSAPPLLCCLRPFTKKAYATARVIRWSCVCVTQFAYVIPGMGFIHLWIMVDGFMGQPVNVGALTSTVSILSMCLAMQGLITLYLATRHFLKEYHPGKKFLAIKIIVILATAQTFIVRACVPLHFGGYAQYDRKSFIDMISALVLVIESTLLGALMGHAFPEGELKIHSDTTIRQWVEGQVEFDRIDHEDKALAVNMFPSEAPYTDFDTKQPTNGKNRKGIELAPFSTPSMTNIHLPAGDSYTDLNTYSQLATPVRGDRASDGSFSMESTSQTHLGQNIIGRRSSYGGTESDPVCKQHEQSERRASDSRTYE